MSLTSPANVYCITGGELLDPEQVEVHIAKLPPQSRTLFAEFGRGDSVLND